jgi:hypothetical protein
MLVSVSHASKKEVLNYFIVQEYKIIERDFSGVDNILGNMQDWRDLAMRHYESGNLLFPETTSLAMLVSMMFTRQGVPAFNTVFFGKSASAKTATLRFYVEDVFGGSIESATASSGKGWLVSHKEGAPPSKMFTEKRVLLVDEMLKAVSTNQRTNPHGYAVELKDFMQKHLQILDREEVDASSGVGNVTGMMICSFVATENDDETLMRALGRAEVMSPAPFRRIQIGYVERKEKVDSFSDVNPLMARKKQMSLFYKQFGANAKRDLTSLLLWSRRYTGDTSIEAPKEWKKDLMERIISEAEMGVQGYGNWMRIVPGEIEELPDVRKALKEKFVELLENQKGILTPCYVSAAIIRGWEMSKDRDSFRLVYDDAQKKMAEELFKYFFQSKLRILKTGAEEMLTGSGGVSRMPYGGV